MHCIAEGDGPPLLLLHGWPSSVWEFHRIIPLLRSDMRVIVPSLPGYGWSFTPGGRRYGIVDIADALHALMGRLGHSQYLVAGGDWGASVAVRLAHAYPDAIQALHLYMMPLRRPETWPESEIASRAALQQWLQEEGGYVHIQGTRPQTLAYGLQDSPVGLMSWIAEKFDRWTDSRRVPIDDLLTTVMIYWVTGCIGSSFWPYWARIHGEWVLDDVAAGRRPRAGAADLPRLPARDRPRPAEGGRERLRHRALGGAGLRRALPGAGGDRSARRQPASLQPPIDRTFSSRTPRGVSSFTVSPTRAPVSALPIGESFDTLPSVGSASGADTSV